MSSAVAPSQPRIENWVKHGIIGGIGAGITYAMFQMIMAAILNGTGAFFMPLRMIAATALGEQALQAGYSLLAAGVTGLVIHMMLSAIFGLVVAGILRSIPSLSASTASVLITTSILGFGLWIVNFYVIANIGGWVWFPNGSNLFVQFFAHTVFFGTVLGLYLNAFARRA